MTTTSASAYDMMLVCEDTASFYRAMHKAGLLQRNPKLLAIFDLVLPPTQVRLSRDPWLVKASVVSREALKRATSARRRDQFLVGRLFQDVQVVWASTPAFSESVESAIQSARMLTLDWAGPDLPARFDVADYLQHLFRTSFRFEVRPESGGRSDALCLAQSDRLTPIFKQVLDDLSTRNLLTRHADGTWSTVQPVSTARRVRRRLFMEWSRVRATARWPKHAITFDGWLDYIVKKAERHSGETIVLTPMERRVPFIFLWPRVLRFLRRQRGKGRTV